MAKIILTTNDNWGLLYKFVDDKDNKDKQKLFKADEYGDFDGEVFIGLEKIEIQPIDRSKNCLYLLPNSEVKITDNVMK